jgi:hypothetical protein
MTIQGPTAVRPRPFLAPLVGLTFLFASLGPLVGGMLFVPVAMAFAASPIAAFVAPLGWLGALLGHAALLIPAYLVGLGPAMATGFFYAFWDRLAPPGWPRVLAAAAIGGAVTLAFLDWIAGLGANLFDFGEATPHDGFAVMLAHPLAAALRHAVCACGAIAGAVSALAAKGIGLSASKVIEPYSP